VRHHRHVFTAEAREDLRAAIIDAARGDPRVSGGAVTGSAASGALDAWSDIDLAFGVRDPADVHAVLDDLSVLMHERGALDHLDITVGAWVYRVFLMDSTLQVDIAVAPAAEFGPRAPTFRLVFGAAGEATPITPPAPRFLVGMAWLYALHVRSSIERGRLWQAVYMLGAMRDHVLTLACVRHGLIAREARGVDRLPAEVLRPLEVSLVGRLEERQLRRALAAVTEALVREIAAVDAPLATRLEPALRELAGERRA
jgi:hypothetical protein